MTEGASPVRDPLLALVREDEKVRAELAADGALFQGYHPRMREVHERNAAVLREIIDMHGWPGFALAGPDGAAAVDNRRRALGMKPMADDGWSARDAAGNSKDKPPRDWHARQREIEEWGRSVGWIKNL